MYVCVVSVAVSAQYQLDFLEMSNCVACLFCTLFILVVWSSALLMGANWVMATSLALFICSGIVTVMTALCLFREYNYETRVWVSNDIPEPPSVTQGTPEVIGNHVVVGTPVALSCPDMVLASHLRAAARV